MHFITTREHFYSFHAGMIKLLHQTDLKLFLRDGLRVEPHPITVHGLQSIEADINLVHQTQQVY
jgi:hypothetical protein